MLAALPCDDLESRYAPSGPDDVDDVPTLAGHRRQLGVVCDRGRAFNEGAPGRASSPSAS
jgi:hypothetical protein